MTYLLDVNALIAFGLVRHQFHDAVGAWILDHPGNTIATCSITELGFVRILAQRNSYGLSIMQARVLLEELKVVLASRHRFLADANDISTLPYWVETSAQTTDGHLASLASKHHAALATLDTRIPGAFLTPTAI